MATVNDIVNQAIGRLGLESIGQASDGDYFTVVVREYNNLMAELASNFDLKDTTGAAWSYVEQTTGPFPLEDRFAPGISAMITMRAFDPAGGQEISSETRRLAAAGYGRITGAFGKTVRADHGLLRRNRFYA